MITGSLSLRFLFFAPPTFRVPFTFASSPLSESLAQASGAASEPGLSLISFYTNRILNVLNFKYPGLKYPGLLAASFTISLPQTILTNTKCVSESQNFLTYPVEELSTACALQKQVLFLALCSLAVKSNDMYILKHTMNANLSLTNNKNCLFKCIDLSHYLRTMAHV